MSPNTHLIALKSATSFLVVCVLAATLEVSCGGKGDKGKGGNDIVLYNNNLVLREEGGALVIAEKPRHERHHQHKHHEHMHTHHMSEFGGHQQHKKQNFMMAVLNEGGKSNKGRGGTGMGGNSKNKGKGGGGGGDEQMNWEELIMGGGNFY